MIIYLVRYLCHTPTISSWDASLAFSLRSNNKADIDINDKRKTRAIRIKLQMIAFTG